MGRLADVLLHALVTIALLALPTDARIRDIRMPDRVPVHPSASYSPHVVELPADLTEAITIVLESQRLTDARKQLIATARHYLGCRYASGRQGPDRFDCSGFTSYVYRLEGMSLARSSREQYHNGVAVSRHDLCPGDLVFFAHGGSAANINHVGMVVEAKEGGRFTFIHAARTGIIISSSDESYWQPRFVGARRVMQ